MTHSDEQAELWALGALMEYDAAALLTAHPLTPEDFTDPHRALAFRAIESLVSSGKPPTLDAVTLTLRGNVAPAVMVAANRAVDARGWGAERFGVVAGELWRLRTLRVVAGHLREQMDALEKPGADPLALAAAAGQFAEGLQVAAPDAGRTSADDLMAVLEKWGDPDANRVRIPSGLAAIDNHCGGWAPNINILGGQPGSLKSGAAMTAAWQQVHRLGMRVGYVGLEEGTEFIVRRLLALTLGLDLKDVGRVRLNPYQQEVMQEECGRIFPSLQQLRVAADASTPAKLNRLARRWIGEGVQCIYVDHGGEVNHEMAVRDRYDLAIRNTLLGLRPMLIRNRVALVWLHHLNREDTGGRPKMRSLKESGYLEAMGRQVFGMWRHEKWPDRTLVECMKGNEMRIDCTLWLKAHWRAGMVEADGGGEIDWQEVDRERREQQRGAAGGWRRGAAGE